jgi:pimeloyl-ACP methyl ester carboxylesterase
VAKPTDGDRIPFYFGSRERRLYGFYHGPAGRAAATAAVLVCSPLGKEHIDSHRCLQYLADRLAGQRFGVMRFDYYGTGDSDGVGEDVTLGGMQSDVVTAVTELCRRAGTRDVMLVGLRAGATATMLLSADAVRLSLRRVVLWDPIWPTADASRVGRSTPRWAPGYRFGEAFLTAFGSCGPTPGGLVMSAEAILLVETQEWGCGEGLAPLLRSSNSMEVSRPSGRPFLTEPGVVPFGAVGAILDWSSV